MPELLNAAQNFSSNIEQNSGNTKYNQDRPSYG